MSVTSPEVRIKSVNSDVSICRMYEGENFDTVLMTLTLFFVVMEILCLIYQPNVSVDRHQRVNKWLNNIWSKFVFQICIYICNMHLHQFLVQI